jgi:hypothetical protein
MSIFQAYTGNAMLNNALITVEALAGLNNVGEITPAVLRTQFNKHKTWDLYSRMKSYTMLFTRNGPLFNDARLGKAIYRQLFETILADVETAGLHQCEISGLRFSTSFNQYYTQALQVLKIPENEINKRDRTINRCWFPLIGALGSDAQALPQAKFDIRIHPVCLAVIQFLPFSALLYRGGVLLFDAANFNFSKDFIAKSVERIQEAITITPQKDSIENIKDFDKGKYLLRAIELYSDKQIYYGDRYTDINLWSFTNSGTGASCDIDRIPSRVFRDLFHLFKKPDCQPDLRMILNGDYANNFVDSLKNGWDYGGLYPIKGYEGVGIPFFEEYQTLIGCTDHLEYAKHIAYLLKKTALSKGDEKLLVKTDAYKQPEYAALIQKTLVEAAKNGKWSLEHHLDIIDNPDDLPVRSHTYGIFKKAHFYWQKQGWIPVRSIIPSGKFETSLAGRVCAFAIQLVQKDQEQSFKKHNEKLENPQEFDNFSLVPVAIRQCQYMTLSQVSSFLFYNYRLSHYGLNDLLRLYFSQSKQAQVPKTVLPPSDDTMFHRRLESFAELYANYYIEKYEGDWEKFRKHVLSPFPRYTKPFQRWLEIAFERMREHFAKNEKAKQEIDVFEETLCYDEDGYYNLAYARFAIHFCLNQQYYFQPLINH